MAVVCTTALISSCTSASEKYESQVSELRERVRNSFSPKFDPIWVAREKKVDKALAEVDRLIGIMDQALAELSSYSPPLDLELRHKAHETLFRDCRKALLQIKAEAGKPKPDGMAAVRIYQGMTKKILGFQSLSDN